MNVFSSLSAPGASTLSNPSTTGSTPNVGSPPATPASSSTSVVASTIMRRRFEDVSFNASGVMSVFHFGVSACLRRHADVVDARYHGASAGALVGACMLVGLSVFSAAEQMIRHSDDVAADSARIGPILETTLEQLCPDDAHIKCSGRLRISCTKWDVTRLVPAYFTHFESIQQFKDALLASAHLPFISGVMPRAVRGHSGQFLDGVLTDSHPRPHPDAIEPLTCTCQSGMVHDIDVLGSSSKPLAAALTNTLTAEARDKLSTTARATLSQSDESMPPNSAGFGQGQCSADPQDQEITKTTNDEARRNPRRLKATTEEKMFSELTQTAEALMKTTTTLVMQFARSMYEPVAQVEARIPRLAKRIHESLAFAAVAADEATAEDGDMVVTSKNDKGRTSHHVGSAYAGNEHVDHDAGTLPRKNPRTTPTPEARSLHNSTAARTLCIACQQKQRQQQRLEKLKTPMSPQVVRDHQQQPDTQTTFSADKYHDMTMKERSMYSLSDVDNDEVIEDDVYGDGDVFEDKAHTHSPSTRSSSSSSSSPSLPSSPRVSAQPKGLMVAWHPTCVCGCATETEFPVLRPSTELHYMWCARPPSTPICRLIFYLGYWNCLCFLHPELATAKPVTSLDEKQARTLLQTLMTSPLTEFEDRDLIPVLQRVAPLIEEEVRQCHEAFRETWEKHEIWNIAYVWIQARRSELLALGVLSSTALLSGLAYLLDVSALTPTNTTLLDILAQLFTS